jgi:4-amino-4-deoxy-L-arabinose transferase-like glycosyltransferase
MDFRTTSDAHISSTLVLLCVKRCRERQWLLAKSLSLLFSYSLYYFIYTSSCFKYYKKDALVMWYTLIDKHGSAHRSRIGECRFVDYVRITRHKKKTRHESLKLYIFIFLFFFGCCPYSTLSLCVCPFWCRKIDVALLVRHIQSRWWRDSWGRSKRRRRKANSSI